MTLVAAHRGLSSKHPENTIAALEAAVQAGFPAVEVDLRATHDRHVVLLHDAGLERTTDGSGRLADLDHAEVRRLETGAGPVPLLEEAFEALDDWQGVWHLELKSRHAARPTMDAVRRHGLDGQVVLSSMDPRILAACRDHAPELRRALIVLGPPDAQDLRTARRLQCGWVHLDHGHTGPMELLQASAAGLGVGAWTVNDPERARLLAASGVDPIITDTTDVLAALV